MLESHRQEIAKLEALYASNPGGRVFVHLAEALRKGGEHERARNILHEGLVRHPDSASGFVVLGRLLVDMDETGEAETAFRQVLDLDGGNLVALRCLGDLARDGGRREEAIRLYRELIARNPSSDDVAFQLRTLELELAGAAAPPAATAETATEETAGSEELAPSVAPGKMDRTARAEPEFGIIELSALPGELGVFAGLARAQYAPIEEEAEPGARALDDDVVAMIESSATPLELEELDQELAAAPVEVNILAAAPELEAPEWSAPAELNRTDEPAAEVEADVPSAEPELETPQWDAAAESDRATEPAAEWESAPAPVSGTAAWDEAAPDEFREIVADTELPLEAAFAAVEDDAIDAGEQNATDATLPDEWVSEIEPFADEYAEPLDISGLADDNHEVIADAAADLADLAPTAEFALADEAVSASVDAVVEYEEETAAFGSVIFDEPGTGTPVIDPAASAFYDDIEYAPVGPEPVEPMTSEIAEEEPEAALEHRTAESEQEAALSPEDEAEPRLEPLWAADAPTNLEALLAGAADVTAEPHGFEVGEPDGAQVSEELRYWTTDPASREPEPDEVVLPADDIIAPAAFDTGEPPTLEAESGDVVTETLADLYLSQGFAERAADVYRALLRTRPGDERLTAKLAQAETSRAMAAEEAGEVWLRGVESAWTGGAGAAGGETTPYTWTEREEREEGVAIGAYLRELITWGAEPRPLEQPEPAVEAPDATEPALDLDAEEAAWETHFSSAEALSVEADPWAALADAADTELESRAADSTQETDPWSMTAEPLLDESWGEAAPDPWAAIPETPADPWLAAEPAGIEAAPAAEPAQPLRASSGNPVEDAFTEWFDQPALPAAGATAQDSPPAGAGPAAAGAEPESNEDEDEDLEMFRAWLQSLKK